MNAWIKQGFPQDTYQLNNFLRLVKIYSMYLNDFKAKIDKLVAFGALIERLYIEGNLEEEYRIISDFDNMLAYFEAKIRSLNVI